MRKYTVGVMIGNIHTDHPSRLLKSIYQELSGHEDVEVHYYLGTEVDSFLREISGVDTDYDYQYYTLYDYSAFQKLDLLIIAYGSIHIYHKKLSKQEFLDRFPDIPVIFMEEETDIEGVYSLIADNYEGMSKCIEHLITIHDYQNIVFIAGPEGNRDSDERLQAYLDTMQAYGIEVEDSMYVHGDYSESVDGLVEQLLDENEDVEAIASANDEMTIAIYRVLQKRGLVVGRDIAVTGFDNMEMASYCKPALTTVWQDTDEMGRIAAEMAVNVLEGKKVKKRKLSTDLIIRGSCGCTYDEKHMVNSQDMNSLQERDVIDVVTSLQNVQHQSWIAPLFIRTLVQSTKSRKQFYHMVGQQLMGFGAKSSYLLMLRRPRNIERDSQWQAPKEVYLVMKQEGEKVYDYPGDDAKRIGTGEFHEVIPEKEDAHQYMSFLIFDGKRQYGVLKVEIQSEDVPFYYIISLQLGVAMRYLELFEKQEEYRDELHDRNEELQFTSTHDVLTNLLNRQGLLEETERFTKKNRRTRQVIFMADLDHLKQINDTFGHDGGDTALKKAASVLEEVVGDNGIVGRMGGDEFSGIFLYDQEDTIDNFRTKVKTLCEEFNAESNLPFCVDISIGCVTFDYSDTIELRELIKIADDRLYDAKKRRKETVIKSRLNP